MVIEHGKQELPKLYNPINIFEIFTFLLNLIWNNNLFIPINAKVFSNNDTKLPPENYTIDC